MQSKMSIHCQLVIFFKISSTFVHKKVTKECLIILFLFKTLPKEKNKGIIYKCENTQTRNKNKLHETHRHYIPK